MSLGGGWSFIGNLTKGLKAQGVELTGWKDADVILIPSSSMISKESFRLFKERGKKTVLRIDNVPRNSRNRNTGTSRLKLIGKESDAIVFQSMWAEDYIGVFLKRAGVIINNSVDEEIFKPEGPKIDFSVQGNPVYLFSRFSRDETKRWEKAWYDYQMIQRFDPNAFLAIIGQFSNEIKEYGFDFFMDEKFQYLGVIDDKQHMSNLLRGVDYLIATYYNDCFSNTYLEALMCGVELYEPDLTGGTGEMIMKLEKKGREYFHLERMTKEYIKLFEEVM